MKRILSTSALTILMASGAAHAQQSNQSGTIFANVPNDPSMLLGTDYIGQTVYSTLNSATEMPAGQTTATTGQATTGDVTATGDATATGEIIAEPDATQQETTATQQETTATQQETVATQQPQSVGEISDIIMTQDGQLEYVVLGVGGFLGIGQQDVAVNFDALSVQPDPQNQGEYMIMISATQEQIENAPEFDPSLVEGTGQSMQTGQTGTVNTQSGAQVETTGSNAQVETTGSNAQVETTGDTQVETTQSNSEMETIEPDTTTVESTGEEAAAETGQAVQGAANNTEQAVENAGQSVSNAAGEAASEAGQAVEQTGDAIENATDEATSSN